LIPINAASGLPCDDPSLKGWSVVRSEGLSHTERPLDGPKPAIPDVDFDIRDVDVDRLACETEFLAQLGGRVREMRAVHGMSRRELSRRCGVSERYVAMIEAGKGNVSIVWLLRIALVFRCT
jgi:DNA-binding XRE family transcriptional regulator